MSQEGKTMFFLFFIVMSAHAAMFLEMALLE